MTASQSQPVLRVDGVSKYFGGVTAVDDVSFSVNERETKSLIGPNGAGKTSLLNCISGLYDVSSGSIFLHENNVTGHSPEQMAAAGIGRTFQITNVFESFSVFENIRLTVQVTTGENRNILRHHQSYDELADRASEIIDEVGLSHVAQTDASALAHGQRRQLEIGVAMATDPDILLLDEPTAGMASEEIGRITALIEELGEEYPIILIEHNVDLVMQLSDSVMVLDRGSLIADGPPEEIRTDERVRDAYLGTSAEFLEEGV